MNSKRKPYKTYTKEFKVEAIRLMNVSDRPSSELAAQLGIRRNQLYKCKEDQSELVTLRQENERLKEEVEILKKAAAYFARELK